MWLEDSLNRRKNLEKMLLDNNNETIKLFLSNDVYEQASGINEKHEPVWNRVCGRNDGFAAF